MKRILFALVGMTLVAPVRARAEETLRRSYTPRAGDREFELDGPAFPIGQINFWGPIGGPISALGLATQPQRGLSVASQTGGGTTTSFGLTGSIGYCATDLLEFGMGLGFNIVTLPSSFGNSGSALSFNAQPFFKLNFGAGLGTDARINPFVLFGAGINYVSASSGSNSTNNTFIITEIAPGLEAMVPRYWGISLFIPFTIAFDVTSGAQGDNKVIGVGLGYGLTAYFD